MLLDKNKVYEVFKRWEKRDANPKGELRYTNIFTLLVAVVMSAQATDVGVNKATEKLFAVANSAEAMVELGEEKLKGLIKTINYYPTKAKRIIALSKIIKDEYDGIVPDNREALIRLPGVGRKTANVVLNIGFGKPTIAVDTHILRTSQRLGFSSAKTPVKVEEDLIKITPKKYLMHAHHWILLHGRYICKARTPDCQNCFLEDLCMKNNL